MAHLRLSNLFLVDARLGQGVPSPEMPKKTKAAAADVRAAARMLGALGGKARKAALSPEELEAIGRKGGAARARVLSPEKKRAIARGAARARWVRQRQEKKG